MSGERKFYQVEYLNRQKGKYAKEYYAIDVQPNDTEQSLYNELLNIGGMGDNWEWITSREISEKQYNKWR